MGDFPDVYLPYEMTFEDLCHLYVVHAEKNRELKRSINLENKKFRIPFILFFIFFGLVLLAEAQSPSLQCRRAWFPIVLLSLAHLIFHLNVAKTLQRIIDFKSQCLGHELILDVFQQEVRRYKETDETDFDIQNWDIDLHSDLSVAMRKFRRLESGNVFKTEVALLLAFWIISYAFMISSSVVVLCYSESFSLVLRI